MCRTLRPLPLSAYQLTPNAHENVDDICVSSGFPTGKNSEGFAVTHVLRDITPVTVADLIRKPLLRGRIEASLVLLILAVEGTFFHAPQWNQNARLAATVAFVEPGTPYTGTFRIDGLKDGDRLRTGDWAESRGAFYSNKAPGVSLLGIVPYFLAYHIERSAGFDPTTPEFTQINAFALNLWISVFWNAVAALALIRRLPRLGVHSKEGAVIVAMVYSFATLVLPFGCSEWGHSTAAAFITLGTLEIVEGSPQRSVLGGLWLGMAALTEYLAAVSLVTGALFILRGFDRALRWRRFVIGSAAPILVLLVYQKICFGSYFAPAASLSDPAFLQPTKIFGLFGIPNTEVVRRILFGAGRGIFYQMPVLLLSLFGVASWYRSSCRAFLVFATTNIALYALSISAMDGWHGGVTTSMRYMIIALPFFCMLLPDLRAFAYRKLFLLLFALSATNMFVLAATSTMYYSEFPLSDLAYPDFWKGTVAFNPVLARIGTRGAVPAFAMAVTCAFMVGWLLRRLLVSGRKRPETVGP